MEKNYKIYNGEFEWLVKFDNLQCLQNFFADIANELDTNCDFKFEAMLCKQIATNKEFLEEILEVQCWTNTFFPTDFFTKVKKCKKIDFSEDKLMTLFLEKNGDDIVLEFN